MLRPQDIAITDFTYHLPDERIALYPLEERDASRLLIYREGQIQESIYRQIADYLPGGALMVFNDTRVINARLRFQKSTGGVIEVFCLEPYEAINDYAVVMNQRGSARWKCMIGGASKWKQGELQKTIRIGETEVLLTVRLIEKQTDAWVAQFSWTPDHFSFAEIVQSAGEVPLPPYIKREQQRTDASRYQTIYAQPEGSVAAPTAGLHFTDSIFTALEQKHIDKTFVTLHVGAGTFKPVKAATMQGHEMHAEWMSVTTATLEQFIARVDEGIIAVGTTSLRTLESLYWLGVKASLDPDSPALNINQWDAYDTALNNAGLSAQAALHALLQWLQQRNLEQLFTPTQLLIVPGYRFRIAKAIITNFHQPESTLLLLVAAAVGNDWRMIYDYALNNGFRFLSYGDGSLLYFNTAL